MIMELKQKKIKIKPRIKLNHNIYMYSSIDSVTEMTSGNLVHCSCMTHGSGNGGNAK